MPFFSVRCSTSHPVVLGGEAIGDLAGAVGRAVVDDEHVESPSRRGARASTSPAAATIASTFSASLYVGSISQGSPDMSRRTLERAASGAPRASAARLG